LVSFSCPVTVIKVFCDKVVPYAVKSRNKMHVRIRFFLNVFMADDFIGSLFLWDYIYKIPQDENTL
jgi:hypothetical protein